MKALLLTCFESNEERVSYVYDVFKSKGFDTVVVTTDFSHVKKEKRDNIPDGFVTINTKPYKKNLSIDRINSHIKFSKDAFEFVKKEKPDLIWIMAPANSLIKEAYKYKIENPDTKLIIDIIDMWPESLPLNINKQMVPFNMWKETRSNYILCADYVVTECDMYQDELKKEYDGLMKTIYWSRDNVVSMENNTTKDKLSLVYIGSINNIIDIDKMYEVINSLNTDVVLNVIGEGEKRQELLNRLSNVCKVIYHGPIRDEEKKKVVFSTCHAGLNIYKKNLYIGLTTKCIDYLQHGLPIINNIKGDTYDLVNKYNLGFNINNSFTKDDIIDMRNNNQHIINFYNNTFTKKVFTDRCIEVLDEVLK